MGTLPDFTSREWVIIGVLCVVNMLTSIATSIQAPFYPQEAEKKGASPTEYGLVFGVFSLVAFISCPIYGKYTHAHNVKQILYFGIYVAGISSIGFGLLDLVDSHVMFIVLSFIMRIIQALGSAGAATACFSITAAVFPGSVATVFATIELFFGLGHIIGPTAGGYLFELGGFMCPFTVNGVMLIISGLFVQLILPGFGTASSDVTPPAKIFTVLRILPVSLAMFAMAASAMSLGFLAAILEPHLRQFHLSPLATGSVFIVSGSLYALVAPLVGRICDTRVHPRKMIIVGSTMFILCYTLIGPAPFMPLQTTLPMICVALVFQGIGLACMLVSGFIDSIRSSVEYGMPDNIATYGIVSGLATSSFHCGSFIGPSAAGLLFDEFGFPNASMTMFTIHGIIFLSMSWFVCSGQRPPRTICSPLAEDKGCNLEGNRSQDSEVRALIGGDIDNRSSAHALANELAKKIEYGTTGQRYDTPIE